MRKIVCSVITVLLMLMATGYSTNAEEMKKTKMDKKPHPPVIGMGAGIDNVKIRFSHFYMNKSAFIDGNDSVINPTQKESTINKALIRIFYGLTDNLMLVSFIPYFDKKLELIDKRGKAIEKKSNGIGDIDIRAKYRFLKQSPGGPWLSMAMAGGIKFPTGEDDEKQGNVLLPPPLQSGSGSTDYILALFATKKFSKNLFLHSNAVYQICTKGANDYEFGDKLIYNLSMVRPLNANFDLTAEINGTHFDMNKAKGIKINTTGGDEIYLAPGIKYNPISTLNLELALPISIWRDLNGPQNAADWKIVAGVYYYF